MRISPILLCLGLAVTGPGAAHAGPTTAAPPGMANGYYAQLGAQALTQVGLESIEGYVDQLLDDPNAAYGFSYVVGCALPFETKLVLEKDGKRVEFEGSLGLAPQWGDGACDLDCQEWVSACMLARTNAYGLPVYIYTDGPHPHLESITREGRDGATVREGAFFGNLFQSPQEQYACRGDDRDPLALTWRVCTRPGNRCGIQALGACGDVDGETGAAVEDPVCDVNEKGLYTHCRSGHGPNAKVWERVITNFMRPTSFGGPRAESCGEPAPAAPPEQTPGDAGAPCLTNDGCGEDLICDTGWVGTGLCTRACDEEMDAEAQCGAGNTCLSIGADPRHARLRAWHLRRRSGVHHAVAQPAHPGRPRLPAVLSHGRRLRRGHEVRPPLRELRRRRRAGRLSGGRRALPDQPRPCHGGRGPRVLQGLVFPGRRRPHAGPVREPGGPERPR